MHQGVELYLKLFQQREAQAKMGVNVKRFHVFYIEVSLCLSFCLTGLFVE